MSSTHRPTYEQSIPPRDRPDPADRSHTWNCRRRLHRHDPYLLLPHPGDLKHTYKYTHRNNFTPTPRPSVPRPLEVRTQVRSPPPPYLVSHPDDQRDPHKYGRYHRVIVTTPPHTHESTSVVTPSPLQTDTCVHGRFTTTSPVSTHVWSLHHVLSDDTPLQHPSDHVQSPPVRRPREVNSPYQTVVSLILHQGTLRETNP